MERAADLFFRGVVAGVLSMVALTIFALVIKACAYAWIHIIL